MHPPTSIANQERTYRLFYRPVLCREAFSWSSFLLRWPCLLSCWHKKVTSTLFKPLNILMFKYVRSLLILCGNVHLLFGSFCFPFCVCVCRYMHVWVPMHVCLCMWRSEDNLKCQPSGTWLFFLKSGCFFFFVQKLIYIILINTYVCMCMHKWMACVCECSSRGGQKRALSIRGAGVTGGHRPHDAGAGNQTFVFHESCTFL